MRRAMRGERRLREQGKLEVVDQLCERLVTTELSIKHSAYARLFYGASLPHAELATRQYLYLRQVLYKLPQSLLATKGDSQSALAYPLPRFWLEMVEAAGFRTRPATSAALWFAQVLFYWAYGCLTILQLLVCPFGKAGAPAGRFAHFEYIGENQTPRPADDGRSFDVMSWYRSWPQRTANIATLTYRVKKPAKQAADRSVRAIQTPVMPNLRTSAYLRFLGWCMGAATVSLLDTLRGRWHHALILSEASLARFASAVEPEAVGQDYLFNNSGWLYRPLWSYEVEQRGARILCYHYSTNSAAFKRPEGYPLEHYTWRASNWPLHVVWDEEHANFVKRAVGEVPVQIAGPIWFSSTPEPSPTVDGPSIAVFDVQPFRPSRGPALAAQFRYYEPATCEAFVNDVNRAVRDAGFDMLWKRKRNIGKAAHPRYRAMASAMDTKGLAKVISPDQSAVRAIEVSDAVISMPFTSTATLAREMGKPSCYYDPNGLIQKDDRGAHDIPILVGYEELASWVRSLQTPGQKLVMTKRCK